MVGTARSPSQSLVPPHEFEDPFSRISNDQVHSPVSVVSNWEERKISPWKSAKWRHTLGIACLMTTVVLWTTSNFLASTIFADDTYSKPYFVTYINTSFFIFPIVPMIIKHWWKERGQNSSWRDLLKRRVGKYSLLTQEEEEEAFLKRGERRESTSGSSATTQMLMSEDIANSQELSSASNKSEGAHSGDDVFTVFDTLRLSIEFCIPWFLANYFTAACLEYTTVASSTIVASTSSIWTLLIGSALGVERFTVRKMLGVLASLAGVALISLVDMTGDNDENRGDFPHKSHREIITGDSMAFISALLYAGYTIMMKKRIGDESRVNMMLFFGFIGIFNVIALWPGFVLLHITGVETFELPPTQWVLTIVMINSASSLVADITWAFAMLLTSPLVVTVGLSMTIPLSLVGQMWLDSQYAAPLYWVGACIVFFSFIFINREENREEGVSGQTIIIDEA
ncbi:hypothetical protein EJ05DRAFT_459628 [Pseudovirgaria hyperparasitica]|uniref:DUF3955 domain-containing protein n=1 Tax=Pseudovirgaria hyperparasitica TaxID=470096 RepID=A0A6A6WKX8_9PEZI|nr:uncharacterized protein EJ05DRAFT_459628 [Pseudovirgaria hyperparasitica]KAF2762822.1 hypothetical protein EJ05DRAFT_459628 [Pseudovirgaria hyperparasitica]